MTELRTRADAEQEERERLAAFAEKSGDSRGRLHPEPEHPYRTAFARDRDRIVHARAFRRERNPRLRHLRLSRNSDEHASILSPPGHLGLAYDQRSCPPARFRRLPPH